MFSNDTVLQSSATSCGLASESSTSAAQSHTINGTLIEMLSTRGAVFEHGVCWGSSDRLLKNVRHL